MKVAAVLLAFTLLACYVGYSNGEGYPGYENGIGFGSGLSQLFPKLGELASIVAPRAEARAINRRSRRVRRREYLMKTLTDKMVSYMGWRLRLEPNQIQFLEDTFLAALDFVLNPPPGTPVNPALPAAAGTADEPDL